MYKYVEQQVDVSLSLSKKKLRKKWNVANVTQELNSLF